MSREELFFNEQLHGDEEVPRELSLVDNVAIEAALKKYESSAAGFKKLCGDIAKSRNPRTIHLVLYVLDHPTFAEHYFKISADQLLIDLTGEIHTTTFLDGKPKRGIIEGNFALTQYTSKDKNLFLLLASEFYTRWCDHHTQLDEQPPGTDAITLFLEHQFRKLSFSPFDASLSPVLKERFIQTALDYFLHNALFSSPSQARPDDFATLFNKLQPELVAGRLLQRLADSTTVTAREKYNGGLLLAGLHLKPSRVDSKHLETVGHVTLFGQAVDLDRSIEQSAFEVKLLSPRGDIGVFNGRGQIVGKFNWSDIQLADHSTDDPLPAHVEDIALTDLFYHTAEANIPLAERERILHEFTREYRKYDTHEFFQKCQVPLRALPLKEQAAAVQLLLNADAATIISISKRIGGNINTLRTCLLTYATTGSLDSLIESTAEGPDLKNNLFRLYEGNPTDQRYPLETFADFVDQAELAAQQLHHELGERYPDVTLSVDDVTQGLITGALHTLSEVGTDAVPIEQFRQLLQKQITEITLSLTFFREIIGLAEQKQIDLNQYQRRQEALLRFTEQNPDLHPVLVDILVKLKKLQPLPALFWTVDRPMSVYNKRSGIKIIPFFEALAAGSKERHIFLEPGAGCGRGIAERSGPLSRLYADFAIVDRVNYSIVEPLKKLIDIERLKRVLDLPDLTEADYNTFIDYIYKTIYLRPGLYQDTEPGAAINLEPWHDREAIGRLTAEPNNLKHELLSIGEKLNNSVAVPADDGIIPQNNGTILYTKRITLKEQSAVVQRLVSALAADPKKCLHPAIMQDDLKKHVPIFPVGMMVGQFMDIKKFKPKQIKGSADLRALVYLEAYGEDAPPPQPDQLSGPDYIAYFLEMADKLVDEGVDISDSVRENFAKSYRLRELYQLQKQLPRGCRLYIVTGPDITNEDYNKTSSIRSVILTKGAVERSLIASQLESSDYTLYTLDEYLSEDNKDNLLKLDATGAHYAQVQKMLAIQRPT